MTLADKLKETLAGHQHKSEQKHENTPGSFPSDEPSEGGRHFGDTTGRHGASGHSHGEHHAPNTERELGGFDGVMDPGSDANWENSSSSDYHNKLHKREDPRRYEEGATRSGGLASSGIPERRPVSGQDTTGLGREGVGREGLGREGMGREGMGHEGMGREGLGRDTSGSYGNDPSATDRGHGVYNTVMGAGSREDSSRMQQHGHHAGGQGVFDPNQSGNHGEEILRSTGGAGTGIGSQGTSYRPNETSGMGNTSREREHIAPSGENRVLGGSHSGSGLAGAGAGAGAAGLAAREAGKHHHGEYGRNEDPRGMTGSGGTANYDQGYRQRQEMGDQRGMTGSGATTGYNQGYNQGGEMGRDRHEGLQDRAVDSIRSHQQERGVPVGHDHSGTGEHGMGERGFGQSGTGQSGLGERGMDQPGIGQSGMGQSGMGQSGMGQSGMGQSGMGQSGMGQSGMGQSGMGSGGGFGSKVLHPCEHCGRDNDISKYFSKEAIYSLHQ
ncbi:hypothetical protein LTR70_007939 [Exophiala xenobiotica]|uniref:Uncharacterized protein n=1 Tax=Lithohypha guttulata TaxID=1690604 RepID=A0ABR0K2M8_9EURO|nr:hypothetical protein LTR24_007511 [Lithohypha guttulata]KAK5312857.1 hypothetical protein LTR70_007939 [Exophiala xenobiotica]